MCIVIEGTLREISSGQVFKTTKGAPNIILKLETSFFVFFSFSFYILQRISLPHFMVNLCVNNRETCIIRVFWDFNSDYVPSGHRRKRKTSWKTMYMHLAFAVLFLMCTIYALYTFIFIVHVYSFLHMKCKIII